MNRSDSETEPLFQRNKPIKTYTYYENKRADDGDSSSTTSTSISDEETFEDCKSGSIILSELEQSCKNRETTTDDYQPESSSIAAIERWNRSLPHFSGVPKSSSSEGSTRNSSAASSVDLACTIEWQTDEVDDFDYVNVKFKTMIDHRDIKKLMRKLRCNHYTAISCEGDFTLSKCKGLFERDYHCEIIENSGGCLSKNYPPRIIVPVSKRTSIGSTESYDRMEFNADDYYEKVKRSVHSRLRTRFVVPVMLFDKKFICRSGTLAVRKTAVFETVRQMEPPKAVQIAACSIERIARLLASTVRDVSNRGCKATSQLLIPNSMKKLHDIDAQIIRDLKIHYICDLMIEDRKKFKQIIRISSSEKINKDIYCDCSIEQMPYPGCKLFRRYHDARHWPEGIVFNWNRSDVNTEMLFSEDPSISFPNIDWSRYKEWDLVDLTSNYLRMLLNYLVKGRSGLLVHCISGWDRTPLFISILRASLWADGVIHQSLDYREMGYLMLAYDWYLFGHNLPDRLRKREEIMHFCFKFLQYITDDEFSITRMFHNLTPDQKGDRNFPKFKPSERKDHLNLLNKFVLAHYFEDITKTDGLIVGEKL